MRKRSAATSDVPILVELRKQQLIDEGLPPISNIDTNIDKQLADYFISALADGSFISWVMENDGKIIATSGVCFYSLPPNYSNPTGRTAYITNMYTKPEYRRKGIAAELLNMVIDEAKSRGYKIIRLHASEYGFEIIRGMEWQDTWLYFFLTNLVYCDKLYLVYRSRLKYGMEVKNV